MYSHVWSIRINRMPLRFELKWLPFLIFSIVGNVIIIILLKFAYNDSGTAFSIIRYAGVAFSVPFTYLCLNEIFYLFRKLRPRVLKFIRICDIISIVLSLAAGIIGIFI